MFLYFGKWNFLALNSKYFQEVTFLSQKVKKKIFFFRKWNTAAPILKNYFVFSKKKVFLIFQEGTSKVSKTRNFYIYLKTLFCISTILRWLLINLLIFSRYKSIHLVLFLRIFLVGIFRLEFSQKNHQNHQNSKQSSSKSLNNMFKSNLW